MNTKRKSPSLNEIKNDGIDHIVLVLSRLISTVNKVTDGPCPCDEKAYTEHDRIAAETKEMIKKLIGLKDTPTPNMEMTVKSVRQAMNIFVKPTMGFPPSWPYNAVTSHMAMGMSLPAAPPAIIANIDLTKMIDPAEIIQLLETLKNMVNYWIREFAVNATPEQRERLRLLLAGLNGFIAALRAGGMVALEEIINFLRIFLKELLTILRQCMSKEAFQEILKQLLRRFLTPLAEFIGGAAGASFLWIALTVIAGAAIGISIGYLIGSSKVGGKTIWEHWGEIFYDWFWAYPDDCKIIFEMYTRAKADRKAYEASGTTLDRSVMRSHLTNERDILQRYIDLECEENMKVYENEVRRLNARLKLIG